MNKNKAYNQNSPHGPSYSAYVTYSKPNEASIAILSLDETSIDYHLIKASFGTTKYCSYFLKGCECTNKDCVFLHSFADENEIIKRGDLNVNKTIFANQHVIAIKIADIFNPEVKSKILGSKRVRTVFPPPYTLYKSKYVLENSPSYQNYNNNINHNVYNNNNNKNNDKSNLEKNNNDENIKKNEREECNQIKNKEKNKIINTNESTSNSSKEEIENNCSKNLLNKPLNSRETSRFSFCKSNEDNNNNSVNIPIQIRYLLDTKINLYNLSKYMDQNVLDDILENEYINSESDEQTKDWGNFIKENNKNFHKNKPKDDLENEVENINKFIMKKVWLYNKESKNQNTKKKIFTYQ